MMTPKIEMFMKFRFFSKVVWELPDSFRENLNFHENLDLLVSSTNLSLSTTFSITHRQTQQVHSWIARELI